MEQINTIHIAFEDGRSLEVPSGTPLRDIDENPVDANGLHYLCALVNNDVVSLSYPLEVDSQVQLLTMTNPHGWRIYRRSVSFLLGKVVKELFPHANFAVEHSLGTGVYCSFEDNGERGISKKKLRQIDARMRDLVKQDLRIVRRKVAFTTAVRRFEAENQKDKYNLLRFRNPPKIVIYSCEGFSELAHGPLADRTGALGHFKLIAYEPGFVIQFPERDRAPEMAPFERQPHLFNIFREHKEWGRILGVRTVGDLNQIVADHKVLDFIRIAEAFHEKKLASIADAITSRDGVRWLLIAGPSSAGKTTSAKRLAIHLRVNGLRPVTISADNYFVNRADTPMDENGALDFEHLETIDLKLFNDHLARLDRGEEVDLPRFNFEKGLREFPGNKLRIDADQMVIVEGIHALNPRLTSGIPTEHKYRLYVSALTQLNLDHNNRISTTDNRLIRRMVRDNMFRGNSALATLKMWPSVRRGEKRWIFPFQKEADMVFNSALDYELAILKPFVEPILAEVKPWDTQYAEARRLMDFLEAFVVAPADLVPSSSLLREFIGESDFTY
jgi:uridine kinase